MGGHRVVSRGKTSVERRKGNASHHAVYLVSNRRHHLKLGA
jgi:hypothetical protein